jgi:hypothetical protein
MNYVIYVAKENKQLEEMGEICWLHWGRKKKQFFCCTGGQETHTTNNMSLSVIKFEQQQQLDI